MVDERRVPAFGRSSGIADRLGEESFDVVAVAADPALRGTRGEDLLTYATQNERALVTENVADFIPLAAQWAGAGKAHTGLIFTNPRRFNRATLAYPGNAIAALRDFLTDPPLTGESWTWWL